MEYDKEILDRTGIFIFNNAVSPETCQLAIDHFNSNPQNQFKGRTYAGVNTSVKHTTDYALPNTDADEIILVCRKSLAVIKEQREGIKNYRMLFSGLQLQKSIKEQGYFKPHSDDNSFAHEPPQILAYIFYLNDVEEGGETFFKYQNFYAKPKRGTLVVFPCTWNYWHSGKIPLNNDKYIITTFAVAHY